VASLSALSWFFFSFFLCGLLENSVHALPRST
jgi:hypothetical protein